MNSLKIRRALYPMLISSMLVSCINEKIIDESEKNRISEKRNSINLLINIPKNNASTYSTEPGTVDENHIDTIFINIFEDGVIKELKKIYGTDIKTITDSRDSIVNVSFEADNLTGSGVVTAEVFANRMEITPITGEISLPNKFAPQTSFMMSGSGTLTYNGTSYAGTIHVVRNVAKLRIRVSKNNVCIPSNLIINYSNTIIETQQVADRTQLTTPPPVISPSGLTYINYAPRTGSDLRPVTPFASFSGGQRDSLYLNENYLVDSEYMATNKTQIKITISTQEPGFPARTADYTYQLFSKGGYQVKRNHIYTLDIKIAGQTLEPQMTLDVLPWEDISIDGNIYGSNLTLNKSVVSLNNSNISSNAETILYNTDNSSVILDWSNVKPEHNIDTSVNYIQGRNGNIELFWNDNGAPDFDFTDTLYVRAGNIIKAVFVDYKALEGSFGLPGSL